MNSEINTARTEGEDKLSQGTPSPRAKVINCVADEPGRRIDSWLKAHYGHVSKGLIQKLIRKGGIRVNGSRTEPNYRLCQDDRLELPMVFGQPDTKLSPPALRRRAKNTRRSVKIPDELIERLHASVVFEDDHYLCLNKPSGLCVHPGGGVHVDLKTAVPEIWPELPGLELAHRLDRDTSGCLVLAKNWQALQLFHQKLRERQVKKQYTAVLHLPINYGTVTAEKQLKPIFTEDMVEANSSLIIDQPLSRQPGKALEAHSRIHIVRLLHNAALAHISITTGRYHQIRRHVASVRQPVVGDRRYGLSPRLERALGLMPPRLLLHARRIEFNTRKDYRIDCPVAIDMREWIDAHQCIRSAQNSEPS